MRRARTGPNRGRWEAIAPGQRLTLTEAADAIGITRKGLLDNYGGTNPRRKLPEGFRFIHVSPRVLLLIRDHATQQDKTTQEV